MPNRVCVRKIPFPDYFRIKAMQLVTGLTPQKSPAPTLRSSGQAQRDGLHRLKSNLAFVAQGGSIALGNFSKATRAAHRWMA